jgi:hypothetical protein
MLGGVSFLFAIELKHSDPPPSDTLDEQFCATKATLKRVAFHPVLFI